MKQCPQCRQTFSDDTLFCLSDGTPLVFFDDSPEELTVIRPIQIVQPPAVQPIRQGVSPIFAYLSVGLLLLLLGGGAVLLGIFAISRMSSGNTNSDLTNVSNTPIFNSTQNNIDKQTANLREQQAQIEKERQRLANERKKIEEEKNKPVETPSPFETPPPTPTPPVNYPPQPTARIKFGRGRVAESVSGKIYKERSFVLEARSGQYLSASVSGGSCVTFAGGGTRAGFSTSSGDNRLNLVNNCNTEASFSLTVSIK